MTTRQILSRPGMDAEAWARSLGQVLWYWLAWASVCPLVYRLYVRAPLTSQRRWRDLAVHAGAGLGVALGLALLAAGIRIGVLDQPGPAPQHLAHELFSRSALGLHLLHFAKYWLVLGGMALVRESRLRRGGERREMAARLRSSRLEAQLSRATLRRLRAQLNPHFLFNALNSIGSLVEQGRNRRAFRMIGVLGGLLRQTLQPPSEERIPLREELAILRRYLELEQLRFGERLRVALDVPAAYESALVPSLILQPLVENVVRHALAEQVPPVSLRLAVRASDGSLSLTVEDDGPGLPEGWSLAADAGLGLSTTAERLRLVYGERHEFTVAPASPRGVRCSIRLPWTPSAEAGRGEPSDA